MDQQVLMKSTTIEKLKEAVFGLLEIVLLDHVAYEYNDKFF